MNSKELYSEFQKTNKENAAQYDLINSENADLFLKIIDDSGNVDINWPSEFGYNISSIKPLEDMTKDKLLCSRIEFDVLEINIELYMKKKIEDFTKEDKEWYELVKHVMYGEDTKTFFNVMKRLYKNKSSYDLNKINVKSLGNCFGYQLDEKISNNGQNEKYNVVVDEDEVNNILKYEPYLTRLKKYVKYNRIWDSNEERAIPKSIRTSCLHLGVFNLSNYKKAIDILDSNDSQEIKKNELIKISILCCQNYDMMQCQYNVFKNNPTYLNNIKTKYGYFGNVASFGDLCGGAKQINTIFDYEELVNFGIVEDAELFYRKKNKFVSHQIEYFAQNYHKQ